ncbi:N-methyl-L-tryptophan oxidase [Devosia sp.]|uniref:N-methyl-L-tryptophan oxidase n=1 Tax=Devosia sp. TaxID=1871048 RepID=UPI001AC50C41|nr:N-methyl-L-tryptophan oxidase [Devosia sp.]MBN9333733.1 N-methyl-L-tryptophan oxidase [Devosia sp.]
MRVFDVAVLGLGAMGSATFYQLAKAGVDVVGIDRHSPPHNQGSTHGESRITRRAIGEGLQYVPLVMRSHEIWRELEAATGASLLHEVGCLVISRANDETERPGRTGFIQRTRQAAERYDIAHEILSAEQIRQRFPQFDVADEEIGYFEPGAGYVEPEHCVAAQLELGKSLGGTALTNTLVSRIEHTDDGVVLHTDQGVIASRRLVLSAGSGAPGLLGAPFSTFLSPTRQTMHWFTLRPELREHWANGPVFIWPHGESADDFFYGFPEIDGLGAIKIADEYYGDAINPDEIDRDVPLSASEDKFKRHVAPRLRGVSGQRHKAVTCLYTATPDSGFVIDFHPNDDKVLIVSPCSGHGFKHSAAIGEAAAQLITTGQSAIDLSAFRIDRF